MSEIISKIIRMTVSDFSEINFKKIPIEPFVLIIQADFESSDDKKLEKLARKLIDYNVMEIASVGQGCEEFHDLIDHFYVIKNLDDFDNIPTLITTWHNDELLEEVEEYYVDCFRLNDEWKVDHCELLILTIEH